MAAITSLDSSQTLTSMVQRWDRRWRSGLTLIWLPRVLAPALVVGLVLAIISRIRPFLLPDQIALIIFIGMVAGTLVMAASIWMRDRSIIHAARRFDVMLGLNERISTALELIDGRIATTDELAQLQLQDAQERAQAAHPNRRLPLRINWREWAGLALLALAVAVLLLLPNSQDAVAQDNAATAAAIEDAEETLRRITEEVASDPTLREEERRELLEVLDTSADTLGQNDVSPEEAFAAVTDTQNSLESLVEMFDQQLNTSSAAAQAAANALQSTSENPQNSTSAYEQLAEALEQLAQASASMNSEQQQELMEQLQQASNQLNNSGNSGLQQAAEQMQQAITQMQSGNMPGASEQMQQAAQSAQQGGETAAQMQQSSQNASQQAQSAAEAAENIGQSQNAQSAESNTQTSAQGGQQEDSEAQEMSGSGENDPQQSSQAGQQSGDQSDQSGSGDGNQGQMGNQPGAESGQLGDGDPGSQSSSNASAQGQNDGQLSAAAVSESGAGAGDEQASGQSSPSGSQAASTDQSNNADGQGERGRDEMIYSPSRIGGPLSEDEIALQNSDPNAPVIQGEFAQNPTGNATVPYSSVFSNYANAASQALENGYVPLGLRDLIRSYFSSLEPSSSAGN